MGRTNKMLMSSEQMIESSKRQMDMEESMVRYFQTRFHLICLSHCFFSGDEGEDDDDDDDSKGLLMSSLSFRSTLSLLSPSMEPHKPSSYLVVKNDDGDFCCCCCTI